MSNDEMAQLRYQETMDAIDAWVRGQRKDSISPSEALGIAKAFLTHAANAIVAASAGSAAFSEGDEIDAKRLGTELFLTALRYAEERLDKLV